MGIKVKRDFIFNPKISVEDEVNRMKILFNEKRIKNVNDDVYYNTRYVKALVENGDGSKDA